MTSSDTAPGRQLTGRAVLFMFLGFFGVIFAVNGVFLTAALKTYTGVVSQQPYRKGLNYNERIAADARQTQLGWRSDITLSDDGALRVVMADGDGKPLRLLALKANVSRPVTYDKDVVVTMIETSPGTYAGVVPLPGRGQFIVDIEASRDPKMVGDSSDYRARRRLWVSP